jgi:membrane protein
MKASFGREFLFGTLIAAAAAPYISRLLPAGGTDKQPARATRFADAASSPPPHNILSVRARDWKIIGTRTYTAIGRDHIGLLAAGAAFYMLFAVFPALGAASWMFGLLADPGTLREALNEAKSLLPEEASNLIQQQLATVTSQPTGFSWAGLLSLALTLFSARVAASSLMDALNVIYNENETRGFLKTNSIALLFTLVAIIVLLLAIALILVTPIVLQFAGLSSIAESAIRYLRWPLLAGLMVVALAVIYRYGPNRKHARWHWISWGSIFAMVLWLIVSIGFSWYVARFNSYDRVYGSLGAVIILVFWFWLTAFACLLGAELDKQIEDRVEPVAP